MATFHPELPRGTRVGPASGAPCEEILLGPAHENDGTLNLFGALRTAMATCGYETVKEFQKAEVMVAPSLQTEGKLPAVAGRAAWAIEPEAHASGDRRHRPRRRLRGPVRPAHRPPGARGHVYSEIVPYDHAARRDPGPPAQGHHPLGRPHESSTSTTRRAIDPAIFELGVPGARHLLRRPAHGAASWAARSRAPATSEFGKTGCTVRRARRLCWTGSTTANSAG